MAIDDSALTYDERKALGFGVQTLVDNRIKVLQEQMDKLYERRRENQKIIDSIDESIKPLQKEQAILKKAREKLSW